MSRRVTSAMLDAMAYMQTARDLLLYEPITGAVAWMVGEGREPRERTVLSLIDRGCLTPIREEAGIKLLALNAIGRNALRWHKIETSAFHG